MRSGPDDDAIRALRAAIAAETDPRQRARLHAELELAKIEAAARERRDAGDALGDDAEAGGP